MILRLSLASDLDLGAACSMPAANWSWPAPQLANSRAVDVPYIDLENDAGLAEECARAKALGFHAKAAIHPRQIDAIKAAFRQTLNEIEEARAAIAAFDAGGGAAIRFQGKMLEAPLIRRYRQIVSLGESSNA